MGIGIGAGRHFSQKPPAICSWSISKKKKKNKRKEKKEKREKMHSRESYQLCESLLILAPVSAEELQFNSEVLLPR